MSIVANTVNESSNLEYLANSLIYPSPPLSSRLPWSTDNAYGTWSGKRLTLGPIVYLQQRRKSHLAAGDIFWYITRSCWGKYTKKIPDDTSKTWQIWQSLTQRHSTSLWWFIQGLSLRCKVVKPSCAPRESAVWLRTTTVFYIQNTVSHISM